MEVMMVPCKRSPTSAGRANWGIHVPAVRWGCRVPSTPKDSNTHWPWQVAGGHLQQYLPTLFMQSCWHHLSLQARGVKPSRKNRSALPLYHSSHCTPGSKQVWLRRDTAPWKRVPSAHKAPWNHYRIPAPLFPSLSMLNQALSWKQSSSNTGSKEAQTSPAWIHCTHSVCVPGESSYSMVSLQQIQARSSSCRKLCTERPVSHPAPV